MKQMYKEIARIIKRNYNSFPMDKMIYELSSYFEREDDKRLKELYTEFKTRGDKFFNEKQFKEWCGVD